MFAVVFVYQARCIAKFIALSEMAAFKRVSRGTSQVVITPAQVLEAPLNNAIAHITSCISFTEVVSALPEIYGSIILRIPDEFDDDDYNERTLLRLIVYMDDLRTRAFLSGHAGLYGMTIFNLMTLLAGLICRDSLCSIPQGVDLWREFSKSRENALPPDDLACIYDAVPLLLPAWQRYRNVGSIGSETACSIELICNMLNHLASFLPPL